MVDIFRASQYALGIVEQALALSPRPQVIWMQLGIRSDEAAKLAEASGIKVVMNRYPKIEYGRLSSEIAWMGVNTRTISAKKAELLGGVVEHIAPQILVTLAGGSTDATMRVSETPRRKIHKRPSSNLAYAIASARPAPGSARASVGQYRCHGRTRRL